MSTATTVERTVTLTDAARAQVLELQKKEGLDGKGLRLFVESGGCSGFSYGMELDDAHEDDVVEDFDGVKVVIDPKSLPYLKGMSVDFLSNWQFTGFRITNPNATSTCGCGHSFSV